MQEHPASWPGIFFHLDALYEINISFSKKIRNAILLLIMIPLLEAFYDLPIHFAQTQTQKFTDAQTGSEEKPVI